MGSFYTNVTVVGAPQESVKEALATSDRRSMLLFVGDFAIVYDEQADTQDGSNERLAQSLSDVLACPAIAVKNHDDDVLLIDCYENGRNVDSYNSKPDYFEPRAGPRSGPSGGDPAVLTRLCGGGDTSEVGALLEGDYLFELMRHEALVRALELPMATLGTGYHYLNSGGEILPPEAEERFIRFGA